MTLQNRSQIIKKLPLPALKRLLAVGLIALPGPAAVAESTDDRGVDAASTQSPRHEAGRNLFQASGCAQCHTLADAGANGSYAPSFDANPHLTRELVLERVTNGLGEMPPFGGLLSNEEIGLLADYVTKVAKPPNTQAL